MDHQDLTLLLYKSVKEPIKLPDVVAGFAKKLDASAAAILVEDRQLRGASLCITHGMDQETIDSYCQEYVKLNPYTLRRSTTPGVVSKGSEDHFSSGELRKTPFYQGWMRPRGWGHSSAVILDTTETEAAILFFMRPLNHPFTEKDLVVLKGYAEHLVLATEITKDRLADKNEINRLKKGAVQPDPIETLMIRFNLKRKESRIALAWYQGQTTKEIEENFGIRVRTAEWYVQVIYKKLDVHSKAEFMRKLQDLFRQ